MSRKIMVINYKRTILGLFAVSHIIMIIIFKRRILEMFAVFQTYMQAACIYKVYNSNLKHMKPRYKSRKHIHQKLSEKRSWKLVAKVHIQLHSVHSVNINLASAVNIKHISKQKNQQLTNINETIKTPALIGKYYTQLTII
jgi:hypothetical protein